VDRRPNFRGAPKTFSVLFFCRFIAVGGVGRMNLIGSL